MLKEAKQVKNGTNRLQIPTFLVKNKTLVKKSKMHFLHFYHFQSFNDLKLGFYDPQPSVSLQD